MKDNVNAGKIDIDGYTRHVVFDDRWYTRGSSQLRSYGLVKLESLKNGQEAPSWLQVN
jgi:hypothetical protein